MGNNQPISEEARLWGLRVKQAREALGISQEELAKLAGTTDATISRYEAGKQMARPESMKDLADALGKPVWWLHSNSEELSDLVAEELVAVFRKVFRGQGTVEAYEHTRAEPLRLQASTRRWLNERAQALRDDFARQAGVDPRSLSDQDLDQLVAAFLAALRRE
jgi:transcriptional regulator with XRE-family HTH domain